MKRQRNFSFKPTRSIVFYFTISSSIIFLIFIITWVNKTNTPSGPQETAVQTLTSNCNPNISVLNGPEDSILKLNATPSIQPDENSSHFSGINSIISSGLQTKENQSQVAQHDEEDRGGGELDTANFTAVAQSAPAAIVFDKIEIRPEEQNAPLMNMTEEQNADSGFSVVNSLISGLQGKENESQVAQNGLHLEEEDRVSGELDSNFTDIAQSAPAILFDNIEDKTEEQNAPLMNKTKEKNATSDLSGINSLTSGLQRMENESQVAQNGLHHDEEDRVGGELDGNFTTVAQSAPDAILFDKIKMRTEEQNAPLMNKTEEQNAASGFSDINSLVSGLQRKENESQVAQHDLHHDEEDRGTGELDGNFTAVAQSAPAAILFDKIEIRPEEQNAPLMNMTEEQNADSGFSVVNSLISGLQGKENESQVAQNGLHHEEEDRVSGELDSNFTDIAQSAPAILFDKIEDKTEEQNAPLMNKTEEKNATSDLSGINSLTSGLQRMENESQVAQNGLHHDEEDRVGGELDGNFTTVAQSAPDAILFDKIEMRTEEQNAPLMNKTEEQNAASGFSEINSLVSGLQRKENESQVAQHDLHHDEEDRGTGELDGNFTAVAQSAPAAILFDKIEIRPEEQNAPLMNMTEEKNAASGFSVVNSLISGLQGKENESQVAQNGLHHEEEDRVSGELDSNFTDIAQSAPAILFDKIEDKTEEQNAPLMNKTKEQNAASGFSVVNSLISGLQGKENESQVAQNVLHHDEEDRVGGELDGNFTTVAQSAPAAILFDKIEMRTEEQNAPLMNKTEEQNAASGFSEINSLVSGLQRKENESQVAQHDLHHDEEDRGTGELDGNFTAVAQSAPAILFDKIEIKTEEQNAPFLNKAEEQNAALSKNIEGKSRKRRGKKKTRATSFENTQTSSSRFVEEKRIIKGGCDFTRGRWVYDKSYPLYTDGSCPFIEKSFNCRGNGRLDENFMKWRWQPEDCDIPRFDATKMLELMRGKRLVFVGDSLNRNQWESMLCMLMGAKRGRRITQGKGKYNYNFVDYKCTVEFYTSPFLVHQGMARAGKKQVKTLQIDSMDRSSSKWTGADILVFNTAHWWNDHKTNAGINFFQEKGQIHPHLDVSTALRKALMTWASWVDNHVNPRKTQVFFRSSSPTHFRGGQWNTGGSCAEANEPLIQPSGIPEEKDIIAEEVIKQMKTPVTLLNITSLSEYRIDGHPSIYGNQRSSGIQDCSHWCLPGIPDVWNELLYLHLQ